MLFDFLFPLFWFEEISELFIHANVYKPPTEHWNNTNLPPVLPHPAVLVGDFNSHHPDWGYQEADLNVQSLQEWALNSNYLLLHDAKQRGTFHSARWQRDYSPDLCWISTTVGRPQPASSVVLGDFPHSQHRHYPPASHHQRSPTQKMELKES